VGDPVELSDEFDEECLSGRGLVRDRSSCASSSEESARLSELGTGGDPDRPSDVDEGERIRGGSITTSFVACWALPNVSPASSLVRGWLIADCLRPDSARPTSPIQLPNTNTLKPAAQSAASTCRLNMSSLLAQAVQVSLACQGCICDGAVRGG